jgi:hypothetical protein
MHILFWLRRFIPVFCIAFAVIVSAYLLRGHELMFSLSESLLWAMISANIFTTSHMYQSQKGQSGMLCKNAPEIQSS